jgi:hypothetical protein
MESKYAWFVPMLEVILERKAAEPRRSTVLTRLRSSISSVAPSDEASNADGADEESSFTPVVRLGA